MATILARASTPVRWGAATCRPVRSAARQGLLRTPIAAALEATTPSAAALVDLSRGSARSAARVAPRASPVQLARSAARQRRPMPARPRRLPARGLTLTPTPLSVRWERGFFVEKARRRVEKSRSREVEKSRVRRRDGRRKTGDGRTSREPKAKSQEPTANGYLRGRLSQGMPLPFESRRASLRPPVRRR
jgi:hypothetical protein